jgi:purine-nucleoside phosphorylase
MTDSKPDKTDVAVEKALATLKEHGFSGSYAAAMVLGTGLGKLADDLTDVITLPYAKIAGFPKVKVSSHAGQLIAGKLEGKPILIFQGRAHFYETGQGDAMRIPIAVLAKLGAPPLLLTNAAGSARADIRPGSMVLIRDHINFAGLNPLVGDLGDARFVAMNEAYDPHFIRRFKEASQATGISLHEGVYMWFSGPSFETPAEIRMARTLGADIVGMSTVPEVILARRYGLRVAGISVVTNLAAGIEGVKPAHSDTRAIADAASIGLRRLIRHFVSRLDYVAP